MRQINPLYIILLLFVILFFILFKLMSAKTALHEAENHFQKTKEMVHKVVELRQNWDSQKRTKNSLGRILKSSLLSHAGIVRRDKRSLIELHSSSMDSSSAGYLVSRLLNETFVLKSIKIRRLNKEHVSFYAEIKL